MSFIQPASIQSIAHSLDVPRLSSEAAKALAPDVEYRLREIIQEAQKFARHSKRVKVTTEDINNALRLRNFEPLYGFSNKDPAKYSRAAGHPDVFFVQDKELTFDQVIDAPLPRTPIDVSVMPHWLFISGVQPKIPENAMIERPVSKRAKQQKATAGAGASAMPAAAPGFTQTQGAAPQEGPRESGIVQVQPPVQHALSKELQLYFNKAIAVLKVSHPTAEQQPPAASSASLPSSSAGAGKARGAAASASGTLTTEQQRLQDAVLASIASDPGLHPLTPYFTKFIADEVSAGLKSTSVLHTMLRLVRSMLLNPHMQLALYIHQLLPPVLTCLVAKGIGSHPLDDHWGVRESAASLVQLVCAQFGDPYFNVPPRISKTLLRALLDASKPLATHYGAIVGLAALGHKNVRLLLLPQLDPYMSRLRPIIDNGREGEPSSSTALANGGGSGSSGKGLRKNKAGALPTANGVVDGGAEGSGAGREKGTGAGEGGIAGQVRRAEAWRVYGVLLDTVAAAMYDQVLMLAAESDVEMKATRPSLLGGVLEANLQGHIKEADARQHQNGVVSKQKSRSAAAVSGAVKSEAKASEQDADLIGSGSMDVDEGDGAKPAAKSKADANGTSRAVDAMEVDGEKKNLPRAPLRLSSESRSVPAILAEAWREDASTADTLWALSELFGEDFVAKMPHGQLPYLGL